MAYRFGSVCCSPGVGTPTKGMVNLSNTWACAFVVTIIRFVGDDAVCPSFCVTNHTQPPASITKIMNRILNPVSCFFDMAYFFFSRFSATAPAIPITNPPPIIAAIGKGVSLVAVSV